MRENERKGEDMTRIEFWSAVIGLLVAIVLMFNQMNGRMDRMQAATNARFDQMFDRMDRTQAETNRRFDTMQTENQRQHDALQTENQRRHDALRAEMNRRFDTMQTENHRQHDAIEEVLRVFEGRITRLEENTGLGPDTAE